MSKFGKCESCGELFESSRPDETLCRDCFVREFKLFSIIPVAGGYGFYRRSRSAKSLGHRYGDKFLIQEVKT